MRLGIYFEEAEDPTAGGGSTFEGQLLEVLLSRAVPSGHELVFLGPPGRWLDRATAEGFHAVPLDLGTLRRTALRLPRPRMAELPRQISRGWAESGFDRAVSQIGVDLLWCLGSSVPSVETPFSVTVWDLQHRLQPFFPEVSSAGEWKKREAYYRRVLHRAAIVVVGTATGGEELERFYGVAGDRVAVLRHPTPSFPASDRPDEEVLARLGVEPGFLFYPAQFWPHKNHVTLLRAVAQLKGTGSRPRLVLVGSDRGGNRPFVEREIARLGLRDHVTILGFVGREELAALYRGASMLTYVSLFGPENLPPLEAMSLGCPVVAARVAGAEEQLGDAALLTDSTDEGRLAADIRKLAGDPDLRHALIERGRSRAGEWSSADFVTGMFREVDRFASVRRNWPGSSDA